MVVSVKNLKVATEMIMGPQDNIHAVALPADGPEEFTDAKIWSCYRPIGIFPSHLRIFSVVHHNVVSRLIMEGRDIRTHAGMTQWTITLCLQADAISKSRAAESIVKSQRPVSGLRWWRRWIRCNLEHSYRIYMGMEPPIPIFSIGMKQQ